VYNNTLQLLYFVPRKYQLVAALNWTMLYVFQYTLNEMLIYSLRRCILLLVSTEAEIIMGEFTKNVFDNLFGLFPSTWLDADIAWNTFESRKPKNPVLLPVQSE